MASTKELSILIKAKDQASKTLGKVSKESNTLKKALKGAGIAAGIATAAIAATATAFVKLGERGAVVNSIEASFKNLSNQAGITADVFKNQLDKSFMGTISSANLMKMANQAMLAGMNPKQINNMAKASVSLAKTLGISTTQAYNQLTNAITRGSSMQLKKFGLDVDAKEAQKKYAVQIGKTTSQLTAQEKKTAVMNDAMEKLNAKVEAGVPNAADFGDSMAKIGATIKNVTDSASKFIDTNFGPYLAALADAAKKYSKDMSGDGTEATYQAVKKTTGIVRILGRAFIILKNIGKMAFMLLGSTLRTKFNVVVLSSMSLVYLLLKAMAKVSHSKKLNSWADTLKTKMDKTADDIKNYNPATVMADAYKDAKDELATYDNKFEQVEAKEKQIKDKAAHDAAVKRVKAKKDEKEAMAAAKKKAISDKQEAAATKKKNLEAQKLLATQKREASAYKVQGRSVKELTKDIDKWRKLKKEATDPKLIKQYTQNIKEATTAQYELTNAAQQTKDNWKKIEDQAKQVGNALLEYADQYLGKKKENIQEETDSKTAALEDEKQKKIDNVNSTIKDEAKKQKAIDKINKVYKNKEDKLKEDGLKKTKKIAREQKAIRYAQAVGNGAMAIINGFETQPFFPTGLLMGALATALVGVQIATINAQTYAQGGLVTGSGTGTSDSIPARISNGEYIMNAQATRNNLPLLDAMNSGKGVSGGNTIIVNLNNPQIINTDEFLTEELVPKINNLVNRGLTLQASEVI